MSTAIRRIIYNPPTDPPLHILHEDDALVICNKQAGLLSVPGRDDAMKDCLESRLKDQFATIFTVHRLDMETSGLMVYARSKESQRALSQLFMDRKVRKEYIADVFGLPAEGSGEINLPLICDWPNRPKQIVDFDAGKKAQTFWEVMERSKNHTRVQLKPSTGRSHQLRVHMQELGHPILGDSLYAPDSAFKPYSRLHLHASLLEFEHPSSGKLLSFESAAEF